ncbi:Rod shape-determining protein MreB [Candidatus Hepatincolaceae symbiont of Richtersius coronifer]
MAKLRDMFFVDIAIDLGTANTLIYIKNKGIMLNEPSVVAMQKIGNANKVLTVGNEAKKMLGRTSGNITAIRPLKDGVIADFEAAEQMIKYFIKKVYSNNYLRRSLILVCVPSGSTPVERRAIQDSAYNAGANNVYLVEEPIAAAIGANLPIMEPVGSMVIDIGGGTTEVAVMSLGGIVYSRSAKVAGDKMDDAIINYVKKNHNMLIGEATAQKIKETIGSALIIKKDNKNSLLVKGLDLLSGFPKEILVTEENIQEALLPSVQAILDICKDSLENTPPELVGDIMEKGIVLAGGGSLLKNLDIFISQSTGVPVIIAPNAFECVARGTGKMIENLHKFKSMFTYY